MLVLAPMARLILVLLAFAVTAPGLGNRFTQDDLPLLLRNETVHSLTPPYKFLATPYWQPPFPPALYRPVATTTLALQWKAGNGNPAIYRWVSAALLGLAAVAVFELGLLLLPLAAALGAALLFVVHPVHVEATALGVNQGEILVALFLSLAVARYVKARRAGDLGAGTIAGILGLYAAASLTKENGLMLPGLLLAAELFLVRDPRPAGERARRLRPFFLATVLVATAIIAVRAAVLGGNVVGTFTADALAGSGVLGRARTMLGVVGDWARLLVWPAQLQADYGLNEILPATSFGAAQWLGLGIVAAAVLLVLASRRRAPVLAFGLCWIALALVPVSNVLVPTGVVLAERTLFLATVGTALAAGAVLELAWRPETASAAVRGAAFAAMLVLVTLGLLRSRARHTDWRDQETLLRRTVLDAPKSFSAHLGMTRFLEDSGSATLATESYRKALAIRPELLHLDRTRADQYRQEGFCRPATRLYRRVLAIVPEDSGLRASLRACGDSAGPGPQREAP